MADKYGLVIGRFQPFHIAHKAIIDEVIADGLIPIVVVGGYNVVDDRHPYDYFAIETMIGSVYEPARGYSYDSDKHDVIIVHMQDYKSWDVWYHEITEELEGYVNFDNVVLYYNNKEGDASDFFYMGKEYKNSHYSEIFKFEGVKTKQVTYPSKIGYNNIHATDIREDLEANKHLLDGRVYRKIKEIDERQNNPV